MSDTTQLSVLTLNCWGLKFVSKQREDRLTAIGHYLADSARQYDIVGLQEVWVYDDYVKIRDICRNVLPYSKHWYSGVLGSGLVVLSKFPIVSTTMRRFALNGDPFKITHGDWYVGKCVVSAVIAHPTCGEIEVFNTHLHAGYDPVGKPDTYLGCRVGEAWEMSSLVKAASTQGRHVISLGDYNSAPDSLVVKLLTMHGGLTDSWEQLHPAPRDPIPRGLTPEQGVQVMGVTCDTPLNTWTKHTWLNYHTGDPVGERLDYIFYHETPELVCKSVEVTVREQVAGIGGANGGFKNYSDHYGVHAVFGLKPATFRLAEDLAAVMQKKKKTQQQQHGVRPTLAPSDSSVTMTGANNNNNNIQQQQQQQQPLQDYEAQRRLELHGLVDLLEEVLIILNQHHEKRQRTSRIEMFGVALPGLMVTLGLIVGSYWIESKWGSLVTSLVLSGLSSMWIVHFLYGFLFGGEMKSAFLNTIEEVQTVLAAKALEKKQANVPASPAVEHEERIMTELDREDQGRILK